MFENGLKLLYCEKISRGSDVNNVDFI